MLNAPTLAREPWVIASGSFVKTGGQDRANFALASYLATQGVAVHLVAHSVAPDLMDHPAVLHHKVRQPFGSYLLGGPLIRREAIRQATALHALAPRVVVNGGNCDWPDVNWVHYVHAAYDDSGGRGALTNARLRMTRRLWLMEERQALTRARIVLANSHRTKRDLVERVGVSPERIRVVYYGIDATEFRPATSAERDETRRRLGWSGTRPIVLFVGALGDRRKGFDTLFQAWTMLAARQTERPLLVVIGQGAMLAEWQQRTADAGLTDAITYLGFRDDVPALMRAADVLVSPTRYEAYGLGVHEALCCGLPAIVSADAGVAEQYPSELQDLLLPDAENANDLAYRIRASLEPSSRRQTHLMTLACRLRARTWDVMAADFMSLANDAEAAA